MGVYKEIAKADGSGITTFYRLSEEKSTVETTSTGTTETMFDYNDTLNKPSINDVALVGNKTLDELGIQPAGDYITEIPEEYITEEELEAKDYATEAFVIEQINNTEHFHREIVDALPLTGKDNILYLVPKKGSDKDIYNEYIWTGVDYELIGTTAVDLTDYYQKNEVDELLDNKVTKVSGKQLSTNDYTTEEKTKLASLENYDDSELQSEVTELNANVSSLEASNTNLYNTVSHLKPIVNDNASSITDIYNSLDDKITAIRLVAQGDGWIWMDLKGNKLLYPQVSADLGHENCVLFIEQLENDGKIIPAEYKIQGEHIDVTYKDLDGKIHFMTCGDDVYTLETTSSTTGVITTEEISQEASGYNLHSISIDGKSEQEGTPTPEAPVEIKTVKGIRNLFDKDNANILNCYVNNNGVISLEKARSIYIPITGGKTYTITRNGSKRLRAMTTDVLPGNGVPKIDIINNDPVNSITISTSANSKYLVVYFYLTDDDNDKTIEETMATIQIEEGSIAHDYVPYGSWLKVKNTGKNLLYTPYTENNKLTKTATKIDDYVITDYYTELEAGKKYTFSCKTTGTFGENSKQTQCLLILNKTFATTINMYHKNGFTFTPTISGKYYLRCDVNISGETHSFWDFQIEEGSTATEYEPYKEQSTLIDMNKPNLLDMPYTLENKLTDTSTKSDYYIKTKYYATLEAGKKYKFSCETDGTWGHSTSEDTVEVYLMLNNEFTTVIYMSVNQVFTPTVSGNYYVRYDINMSGKTHSFWNFKITESQEYYELSSIGDTKDILTIQDRKAYINQKIGKIVLDGSESWEYSSASANTGVKAYKLNAINNTLNIINETNGYSNRFIIISGNSEWSTTEHKNSGYCRFTSNNFYIRISETIAPDLATLKTWLSNNPVTVYYILKEPQTINTTSTNIKTFEGVNHVSLISSLEPSNFEITYLKDLVINATDTILGKDTYWNNDVPTVGDLPTDAREGEIRIVKDSEHIYIYDGTKWIPFDKTGEVDLSNYLSKDNTIAYKPTTDYNPSTKRYVDDSIANIFIPTKTSHLTNDSGFISKSVNNLTNYYNKSNTYNKAEVNALVSSGGGGSNVSITVNGDTLVITTGGE